MVQRARTSVAGDRRAKALTPTENGRAILADAKRRAGEAEAAVIGLSEDDVRGLRALLHQCLARQEPR